MQGKDNPMSSAHIVIAKSANSYDNQAMISNTDIYSEKCILNNIISNAVPVNTNSKVAAFTTSKYGSFIFLSTDGMSNAKTLLGNTQIRSEKEDTPKVYNILEMYIITDTNKTCNSVDSVNIKDAITTTTIIGFISKYLTKKKLQSISQELLQSVFEVNGFVYDLPIEADHCEF